MDILELKKTLDAGKFSKVYVFTGQESFLKRQYAEKIGNYFKGSGFDEFNFAAFEGGNFNEKELYAFIETMPVIAKKKFLHIKNTGVFKTPSEKTTKAVEYIMEKTPDYLVAVIDEEATDGRNGLLKKSKKNTAYVEFNLLNKSQLSAFVKKKFEEAGKKASPQVCDYMAEYADEGLYSLNNEAEKILAFIGEENEITLEVIKNIITRSTANRIFELIDAVSQKEKDKAFKILYELKTLREQPVKIIAILGKQLSTLLKVRLLLMENRRGEIAAKANIPPFFVNKYIAGANAFSVSKLREIINIGKKADAEIKTGEKDEETALLLLMEELLK